jgi:hypothetical protein
MTLTEILPSLRKLSDQEKIKAIQFLAAELAKNAQNSAFLIYLRKLINVNLTTNLIFFFLNLPAFTIMI